jgi:multiple sugar transport system ATP-binding protein
VATRAEIARLHQRLDATMIYVTHDQVEAMTMGDRIAVINEGVLQQAGTPKEMYATPHNRFVAGFIGSPSMNFVDFKVDGDGYGSTLSQGATEVRLDDSQAAMMRGYSGSSVTMGFRPEHLAVGKPEGPGLTVTARIDVIEFLGNDELIHGISDERDVVAIVNTENPLKVGLEVALSAPPSALYFFDPQTGLAMTAG